MGIRFEHLPATLVETGSLARAALEESEIPGLHLPRELASIEVPAERFERGERASLALALESNLAPLEPPVAVLDSARALRAEGAALVVTGQQPGFLASPLYSLHKALHAVRLARSLAQAWERPVVPLFWNHADDHDVAEVHHTFVVNEHLDLQKVSLSGLSSGRQPLSRIRIDGERQHLAATRALLGQMLSRWPHAEAALELFLPRSGETLARAFTRAMTNLVGRFGLVVLEPDWIREDLSRALARAVASDPLPTLLEGAAALGAAGFEAALDPAGAALVYRVDRAGRRALRAGGEGFRYDGEPGSRTAAELAAEIVGEPEGFSAGALLRPVVQDLCLPVAAYIGGWGELAYHAELGPLRRAAGAPKVPFVPRFSCTLVDPDTAASLERLGLGAREVLAARGELADGSAGDAPAVIAGLRSVGERAARELSALRAELFELDPSLASTLPRTAGGVRGLVEKLCEKAERVHANRSGSGRRHARRAANHLFPRGEPQERVLGPIAYVARFGTDWLDLLLEGIRPLGREHAVAWLEDAGASAGQEP